MDDRLLVRGMHRIGDVGQQTQATFDGKPVFYRELRQRQAVDVFHRDIRNRARGACRRIALHAGIDDARDAGVIDATLRGDLPREPARRVVSERMRPHQLERDRPIHPLLLGEIDRRHAPFAEQFDELVLAERTPGHARGVGPVDADERIDPRMKHDESPAASVPVSSSKSMSDSASRSSSASPAQASSRNRLRSKVGRSSASATISLRRCHVGVPA